MSVMVSVPSCAHCNILELTTLYGSCYNWSREHLMAKLDIKSAYRIVPVRPQYRFRLGMRWNDHIYVDRALLFG